MVHCRREALRGGCLADPTSFPGLLDAQEHVRDSHIRHRGASQKVKKTQQCIHRSDSRHTHKRLSILEITTLKHKMTKLEALKAECASYKKQLDEREEELRQTIHDLGTTRRDKDATENQITTSKKDVTYVDAKLLDGTVVRMEAHQLLMHQISEIERLESTRARLEARLKELRSFDPGANRAASIIQSRYVSMLTRKT